MREISVRIEVFFSLGLTTKLDVLDRLDVLDTGNQILDTRYLILDKPDKMYENKKSYLKR